MRHFSAKAGIVFTALAAAILSLRTAESHESPVDHVDREVRIWISEGRLYVRYRMQVTERAAMIQLHRMDGNGNGVIEDEERSEFFNTQAKKLSGQLRLELNGTLLGLSQAGEALLDAQLGQTFTFVATPGELARGTNRGRLEDDYSRAYPGPYRCAALTSEGDEKVKLEVTERPAESKFQGHPGMVVLKFELEVE